MADGLTQRDAGIFGRVMGVDVQVTLRRDVEVDEAVASQLLQHMVEKTDAGFDVMAAGAIERHRDGHGGFVGFAADAGLAHGLSREFFLGRPAV